MTVLETARLILRPFDAGDAPAHAALYADPDVTRYLPGGPFPPDAVPARSERSLTRFAEHWRKHGWGVWAVVDKATAGLIGQCGLNHLPDGSDVELLYALSRPSWGRGLATEAGRAALEHGFGSIGSRTHRGGDPARAWGLAPGDGAARHGIRGRPRRLRHAGRLLRALARTLAPGPGRRVAIARERRITVDPSTISRAGRGELEAPSRGGAPRGLGPGDPPSARPSTRGAGSGGAQRISARAPWSRAASPAHPRIDARPHLRIRRRGAPRRRAHQRDPRSRSRSDRGPAREPIRPARRTRRTIPSSSPGSTPRSSIRFS